MSHFTVMVIGNEPEEQLEPFSEQIEVDEYEVDLVSEEERDRFEAVYTVHDPNRTYAILSESEVEENNKLSFDELYEKYGENWNGNSWRKNEDNDSSCQDELAVARRSACDRSPGRLRWGAGDRTRADRAGPGADQRPADRYSDSPVSDTHSADRHPSAG